MFYIYLSPSTQEYNLFITGGNEETYMNLIADAMEPYLQSSGINFTRNFPTMTASSSIAQSNSGNYNLHLAIHSNAAPDHLSGLLRGTDVYYYPTSIIGAEFANILVNNFKNIYPIPELVTALPTTSIGEVRRTNAPSVLIEIAYHDNIDDANWIKNNIEEIARALVLSICETLGIPFVTTIIDRGGIVTLTSGFLNIRENASVYSNSAIQVTNGEEVFVFGEWGDWYIVEYGGIIGYAAKNYIQLI